MSRKPFLAFGTGAALLCVVAAVVGRIYPPAADPLEGAPGVILWAWERPEDLRSVAADRAGVAFLAGTVNLRGAEAILRHRMQPLQVAAGAWLMAVTRVEADTDIPLSLSEKQRQSAAAAIAGSASLRGVRAVQVDFDATVSQRQFYRSLLEDLRAKLPEGMPLSITALASWCMGDPWIAGLPVDEAVPMLFQMGPDGPDVFRLLERNRDFRLPVCQLSIGVSTDEPLPARPPGRRTYIFHPRSWDRAAADTAIAEAERWR
jgi:hypothetical protein